MYNLTGSHCYSFGHRALVLLYGSEQSQCTLCGHRASHVVVSRDQEMKVCSGCLKKGCNNA